MVKTIAREIVVVAAALVETATIAEREYCQQRAVTNFAAAQRWLNTCPWFSPTTQIIPMPAMIRMMTIFGGPRIPPLKYVMKACIMSFWNI